MEITPEALRIVMERARFSKDQALKFKNALFAERENRKRQEDQYKDLEYHRATADNANVRYAFAPNGRVLIDGSISLDTNRLLPEVPKTAQRQLQMRHRGQRKHELCQKH